MKFKDLTGCRFGRWTVLNRHENIGKKTAWFCRCDCGNTGVVTCTNLTLGKSKSCGCLHVDVISSHKMSKKSEYNTWHSIRQRCYNPNHSMYYLYGGKGIKVCDRWLDSFDNFLADMGMKPFPNLSIDRIDPNGDYSPSNCRWSNAREQANNRTTNVMLTFDGKTKTIAQWARDVGLRKGCLVHRVQSGWTIEKALTAPSARP